MKKILVTGANGQLGAELQQLAGLYPQFHFRFTDRSELPIDQQSAIDQYLQAFRPDYCINCAAYTAVDKAESDADSVMLINGTAVGWLAEACKREGCRLIHISTDYVFDGTGTQPMKETDPVHPLGVYGRSKLMGEELALRAAPDNIVIRTSWVYSSFGNNFVKTMIRLMRERKELKVVADQVGSPTFAADLAKALLEIITVIEKAGDRNSFGGIYHYSNEGIISWYDFAIAIREGIGSNCVVHPIPTSDYPTAAVRPGYSVLDKHKITTTFGLSLIPWRDSLQACLLQIQQYWSA
jgi:dTDP-4-dehydrorhamnose reductase